MDTPPSNPSVDPKLLNTVIEVIKQDPRSQHIKGAILEGLAIEALQSGLLENKDWLEQKLTSLAGQQSQDESKKPEDDPLAKVEKSAPQKVATQEELDRIIERHRLWKDTILSPDNNHSFAKGRANLSGADLRSFCLDGVDLSCADLSETDLRGVSMVGANLSRARLQRANLQGANLGGALLKKAQMQRADLRGAMIDDCIFEGVDQEWVIFKDSDLESMLSKNNEDCH